jgi:hypothetical protein
LGHQAFTENLDPSMLDYGFGSLFVGSIFVGTPPQEIQVLFDTHMAVISTFPLNFLENMGSNNSLS